MLRRPGKDLATMVYGAGSGGAAADVQPQCMVPVGWVRAGHAAYYGRRRAGAGNPAD
jgi:hypothetical protein